MTKAKLTKEVASKTGVEIEKVIQVFESSLIIIRNTVALGEGCYFRGFGTFIPKKRAVKKGQNIAKRITVTVPEHNIAFFKPGKEFNREMKKLKVS